MGPLGNMLALYGRPWALLGVPWELCGGGSNFVTNNLHLYYHSGTQFLEGCLRDSVEEMCYQSKSDTAKCVIHILNTICSERSASLCLGGFWYSLGPFWSTLLTLLANTCESRASKINIKTHAGLFLKTSVRGSFGHWL